MKKIVTLLALASFLLVGVVGCGGAATTSSKKVEEAAKKDK